MSATRMARGIERSRRLVGAAGIEPATTCSQSRYATAALRPVGGNYRTWLAASSEGGGSSPTREKKGAAGVLIGEAGSPS